MTLSLAQKINLLKVQFLSSVLYDRFTRNLIVCVKNDVKNKQNRFHDMYLDRSSVDSSNNADILSNEDLKSTKKYTATIRRVYGTPGCEIEVLKQANSL